MSPLFYSSIFLWFEQFLCSFDIPIILLPQNTHENLVVGGKHTQKSFLTDLLLQIKSSFPISQNVDQGLPSNKLTSKLIWSNFGKID